MYGMGWEKKFRVSLREMSRVQEMDRMGGMGWRAYGKVIRRRKTTSTIIR